MKNVCSIGLVVLAALVAAGSVAYGAQTNTQTKKEMPAQMMAKMPALSHTESAVDLRIAMRKLWEDHVGYTRNYIISALAGLEDVGKVADRLLRNQVDIGDAIKPFYGDEAGKKLTALLTDHIAVATVLVKAAKAGDNAQLTTASKEWYANADSIAAFLSAANPKNWPRQVLEDMLHKHLEYTTEEVTSRLKKDWVADIAAYDKGEQHMLMLADALTDGIVKQFPDKFGGYAGQ